MSEPTGAVDGPTGAPPPYPAQPPAYRQGQPLPPYGQPQAQWAAPPHYEPPVGMQPYGQPTYPSYPTSGMGLRLVTPGGRLGAALLDAVLVFVTLGIGWLIWTLITWGSGQTPAKQLLHQVVADARTGQPFTWGRMFLREFVVRGLLFGLANVFTLGVFGLVDVLMVFREDRRTLHDLVSGSVVAYSGG